MFENMDEQLKISSNGSVIELASDLYNLNEEDRPVIVYLENDIEEFGGDVAIRDGTFDVDSISGSVVDTSVFRSGSMVTENDNGIVGCPSTDVLTATSTSKWADIDAKMSTLSSSSKYISKLSRKKMTAEEEAGLAGDTGRGNMEVAMDMPLSAADIIISADPDEHMSQAQIEEGSLYL